MAVSAGAVGKTSESMYLQSTYYGWNITNSGGAGFDWAIMEAYSYPYLLFSAAANAPMPKRPSAETPAMPKLLVKLTGKKLTINAPANAAVSVRLIDIRGRIAARRNAEGTATFSLTNIPAGRYIVETTVNGKRADVRRIVNGGGAR
jgi:hypothetical protein